MVIQCPILVFRDTMNAMHSFAILKIISECPVSSTTSCRVGESLEVNQATCIINVLLIFALASTLR